MASLFAARPKRALREWALIALWSVLIAAASGVAGKHAALASESARVALVIGNGAYPEARIDEAAGNALAVAEVLRSGGFDVVYAENARKADFAETVNRFAERMETGATAVVYYSGHALSFDGRNFLVPVDANIRAEGEIRAQAFDADLLLDPLIVRRASQSVVILDASRANPWTRVLPGRARGLSADTAIQGVSVISAASPGKLAAGNDFSAELVKAMKTPGLGFDKVVNEVRAAVLRATGKEQTVWASAPPPKTLIVIPAEAPRAAKPADAVEAGFWETIQNSASPADYKIYLDTYPNGQFAPAARRRLLQLEAQKKGQTPQKDETSPLAAPAKPEKPAFAQTSIRDCPVCPEVVTVPAGAFDMGSSDGFTFERPVHRVEIQKPFSIGRREVTFDEWDACVSEGGCPHRPEDRGLGRGLRPATNLDWNDAKTYLRWLSAKSGHVYRLPSEAEWEYAARGGASTIYPWGDAMEKDRANCLGCTTIQLNKAIETGTFPANRFGLFDMAGNAAEWVEDCWSDNYSGAPADGSSWTTPDCRERVLRGGSFNNEPRFVRTAARFKYDHNVRYYANGFRVVRE